MEDYLKINECNLIISFNFNFITRNSNTTLQIIRLILLHLQMNRKKTRFDRLFFIIK